MAYRVHIHQSVSQETSQLPRDLASAWARCIAQLSRDPRPRKEADGSLVITAVRSAITADEYLVLSAAWFPSHAICFTFRRWQEDDDPGDGTEGEVLVFYLRLSPELT